MSDATVSRLGQANLTGDAKALFLKVFSGEVLTAFQESCVTADKHLVRTITSGKSAQFPILGKISAQYHTPGAEIAGLSVPANEQVITIDDLLISHAFIASIDEAMNHYDVRGPYSTEMGRALSYTYDKHILQLGVLAARASAPVSTEAGGGSVTDSALLTDTTGEALVAALFAAAQKLDEKFIPADERYAYLTPAAYYMLAQNTKLMNSLWGGQGSYAKGELPQVAGINLVKAVHAPFGSNIATVANGGIALTAGTSDKYAVDATSTAALVMHKAAVGTVKLMDLAMESDYDIRRQGTLMVAKYAMGHGILRPAAAVELKTA
ncbi:capsid protein [Pseudomonas juntendi]|jgi:hypothetical protein|uniref:hypothetical protein n=1 Tax=Pseudomonas TaxID=286 RepID=UPI0007610BC7|nr:MULTISPECIES: hypothetical protein [Pseudomonas]MBH3383790.1 capsid protein [Pseudomonas juntendi]MCE0778210.1 capsid protein [Pseudomonas sp. NMI542_15]